MRKNKLILLALLVSFTSSSIAAETKMTTLDGSYNFTINPQCMPTESDLAKLTISGSKPVSITLDVAGNDSFSISNILGVCENKITVCDKSENKRICNDYIGFEYTDGKNEGIEYQCSDGSSDCAEKSVVQTNICYDINECMNWQFGVDESGDNVIVTSASGNTCTELLTSGITNGQKDFIISHLESVLGTYSKSGLSRTEKDDDLKNITYKQASFNPDDSECFQYSSTYGSGYTNISDLTAYFEDIKNDTNISDSDRKERYNTLKNSVDNGMVSSLESQKTIDDYDNLSSRLDSAYSNLETNSLDNVASVLENLNVNGTLVEDVSELGQSCYNPTCTVDRRYVSSRLGTDGEAVGEDTTSKERVFRQCELSSVTATSTTGNYYDNGTGREYVCPLYDEDGITEEIIYQSDGSACSCENEYEQTENLKNVLMGFKLAEIVNEALCPKDDQDNETINAVTEKRAECLERCDGEGSNYSSCYSECMSETIYGLSGYEDYYNSLSSDNVSIDNILNYNNCVISCGDNVDCMLRCADKYL